MIQKIRQRGEGRIGCMFWGVVLAIVALIGIKMIPVKYASSQFFDYMDEQAKFAQKVKPDLMKRSLMKKARELQLPLLPGKADAVIGMRRSGKTYFLFQQLRQLEAQGIPRDRLAIA